MAHNAPGPRPILFVITLSSNYGISILASALHLSVFFLPEVHQIQVSILQIYFHISILHGRISEFLPTPPPPLTDSVALSD